MVHVMVPSALHYTAPALNRGEVEVSGKDEFFIQFAEPISISITLSISTHK
jgi:hypothetical protein